MQHIKAIGFDLFDTLVTVQSLGLREAMGRLMHSLEEQGFAVQEDTFVPVYREAVAHFRDTVQQDGRETHNRFWISAALQRLGYAVLPDDRRIALAVEAYFSAFLDHATLLPDTCETLAQLQRRYHLGLLSNFTHAPAAKAILDRLGLTPYLGVTLISGELGYRKPHWRVFDELERRFGVPKQQIAFIGDDVEADVHGARQAGMQPIWTTYARAHKPLAHNHTTVQSGTDVDTSVPMIASWHDLLTLLAAV